MQQTHHLTFTHKYNTINYHSNDADSLSKHSGKSGGGSLKWYSYLEGHLANILPIHGEGLLIGTGHLYGIQRYILLILLLSFTFLI